MNPDLDRIRARLKPLASKHRPSGDADPARAGGFSARGAIVGAAARFVGGGQKGRSRLMKRPWMPLYVGDYLGDTGHLTTAQHGAYLLLMMHYWRKGELPDDDRQLSKITKLPLRTWGEYRPVLQDFFHSGWRHKRIDTELERMVRVSERRAIAGQKGGLGSALARMKLENAASARPPPSRAIAASRSGEASASGDHPHPDSHQNLLLPASGMAPSAKRAGKEAIPVSAEFAAYVARKGT
jgi:uncharacterized protein YdaU (DUF1376 family)